VSKTTELEAEVQELTWALIDDEAAEGEVRRLEELLLHSHEAGQIYAKCLEFDAELYSRLGGKKLRLAASIPPSVTTTSACPRCFREWAPQH
jgi:hypothetical protein